MRRLVLQQLALSKSPRARFDKQALLDVIHQLAYVQVDSINIVERAHHMILYSRNRNYKREMLYALLEEDRELFEHWTHDACILPVSHFPHWVHRFDAARTRLRQGYWRKRLGARPNRVLNAVRRRIDREGPLRTRDFENATKGKRESWWGWTEEKSALEYLWRTGELGITRREGFEKVYDRMENVVPARFRNGTIEREASIDWKCREALLRMGAATPAELAGFWNSFDTKTARAWIEREFAAGGLIEVLIETADGSKPRPRVALPQTLDLLKQTEAATRGMRLVSPFDPVVRDRKRARWLYGFDYRIEVFVPANQREYGYYVLPILEGERFTGRIDLKAHRADSYLEVIGLWWEAEVENSAGRMDALAKLLAHLATFVGVKEVRGLKRGSSRKPKR